MLLTVLFYIIACSFALALIAWSAGEMLHQWQLSACSSLLFGVGTFALLVRLVVVCVTDDVRQGNNIWVIFTFALAVMALYLHFRLFGTMLLPGAALIIVGIEMLQHMGHWSQIGIAFNLEGEPWLGGAVVLASVGLAFSLAWLFLALSTLNRRRRLAEAERLEAELDDFPDEAAFRAHTLRVQFIDVSRKMQRTASHLGWWCLAILSFAIAGFALWCNARYGVYWLRQPLFVTTAFAWLVLFIGKDMLFVRSK